MKLPPFSSARRALGLVAIALSLAACAGEVIGPVAGAGPVGMGGGPGALPPGASGAGGAGPAEPGPMRMDCDPTRTALAPARLWQLTDRQYVNVVRDVFGLTLGEEDGKILSAAAAERFTNYSEGTAIDTQSVPNYQTAALRVADLAQGRLLDLVGAAAPSAAQMRAFITERIARAWRRPLDGEEISGLLRLYVEAQPDGPARGFHLVMQAALQAGSFLYRTELGTGAGAEGARQPAALTAHELASALSFLFLESAPDDGLWAHAQAGDLGEPAVLAAEVDRLLALPATRANLAQKASYWLGLEGIANRSREAELYPEWTESVKAALAQSVRLFVSEVVASGTLADLFTSNRVYLNRELATLYGVTGVRGSALLPVMVPGAERSAGILSQPGFIVATSKLVDRADVVHRGLAINNAFICGGTIPPAPPEAGDEAKKMDGTERERAAARASKPACLACHQKFDPPGLTFERYDALGRYQPNRQAVLDSETGETSWQSGPVDASAVLVDDGLGGNLAGPVDGLPALAARLAGGGERVANCASRKLIEYALGFNPEGERSCELAAVKRELGRTGSFMGLFRALALSPGFRARNLLTPAGN